MLDRLKEKQGLTHYDLNVEMFTRFNLQVSDASPLRNVFLITTDRGNKILKKIDYSIEELEFIYSGIKYIKQKFSRVMDYEKTKEGNIYIISNDEVYCILDLVEGRECDFNNPIDISISAKGLAELHLASEGFKCTGFSKNGCGKLLEKFNRRVEELKFFRSIANLHENKSEFDKVFLENVDYYEKEMLNSIKLLETSMYLKLCGEEDKVVLCHHDLAHHNILINNQEAYFVDFDYAVIDLKVHDICNFINKVVKNFAFDEEKAQAIIRDYKEVNSIDSREMKVLYAMLCFPEEVYAIVRDYYTRRKDWSEELFFDRLIRKVGYKEERSEFLRDFGRHMN